MYIYIYIYMNLIWAYVFGCRAVGTWMKLFAFGIGRLGCVNRVLDLDTYYRGLKNYPCCFLNFACSIMGPRTLFELLRPYSTAHNLACFLRQEMSARDLRHGAYLAGVVQEGLGVQVAL